MAVMQRQGCKLPLKPKEEEVSEIAGIARLLLSRCAVGMLMVLTWLPPETSMWYLFDHINLIGLS